MATQDSKKVFGWGCSVPIDPTSEMPTTATITHCSTCECPGPDESGVLMVIIEKACELHESNVVKYMIPVVNGMAREAAMKLGLSLHQGIDHMPMYRDKVKWVDGLCVEVLGRGFTSDEFDELFKLPRGQKLCSWVL
ncbi:Uu.00g125190.m01.CDS01 [Anthostomella pinea]|uniref:Uu.00g125190.m01.CDS01 n=1 Tax=Anthostomella pinea TaxID=933095 RepID=A0AAI8VIP0_9PEZI|nr:Uu.00g125190.m01.CDS01 [Anthostomella pinea]